MPARATGASDAAMNALFCDASASYREGKMARCDRSKIAPLSASRSEDAENRRAARSGLAFLRHFLVYHFS